MGDPGPDGIGVAQPVEPRVDLLEHFLEDVLGIGTLEIEALNANRVDVAGEPLDEDVPGLAAVVAAASDELCVAQLLHASTTPGRNHIHTRRVYSARR